MKGGCKRTLKSDMVLLDRFCFTVYFQDLGKLPLSNSVTLLNVQVTI